jgi:hypothetical protein
MENCLLFIVILRRYIIFYGHVVWIVREGDYEWWIHGCEWDRSGMFWSTTLTFTWTKVSGWKFLHGRDLSLWDVSLRPEDLGNGINMGNEYGDKRHWSGSKTGSGASLNPTLIAAFVVHVRPTLTPECSAVGVVVYPTGSTIAPLIKSTFHILTREVCCTAFRPGSVLQEAQVQFTWSTPDVTSSFHPYTINAHDLIFTSLHCNHSVA